MNSKFRPVSYWLATTMIVASMTACREKPHDPLMFTKMSPGSTEVDFTNSLHTDDDFNIIEYLYFYNGGGIALGDINNDGLPDLYFSSNQESNRLYLNKGQFRFEDITEKAGVAGAGNWKTGVTMADVNGDGFLDIYACGVGGYKMFNGENRLYINRGDLTFADSTEAYGLSFQGFSSQGSFFDYDNDGDLDLFLVNHAVHTARSIGPAMMRFQSDAKSGDKLYRNERIPTGKNYFHEVTSSAGILNSAIGYGLGVAISDLNRDGFMDIYVSNDFHENDYLYINQGNGKFVERLTDFVPHSSRFSMGVDIADINNDGWTDVFTLDMLPRDEGVIKSTAGEDPYDIYEFKLKFGYHYQFARNALQLNRGPGREGDLMFSDVAPLAGIEATDWSWGPVIADFDHDGNKDVFVANGIVGRPNDLDYINYISSDSAQRFLSDRELTDRMPGGAVPNMFFRNGGGLRFEDVSATWTGTQASLSNGAAAADLDNDGDLDLVVNNLNAPASLYRNELDPAKGAYLKVALTGTPYNVKGVGSVVSLWAAGKSYVQEQVPTRGWLSATDQVLHFGLPSEVTIDSLVVKWPDGRKQVKQGISPNQTLHLAYTDAVIPIPQERTVKSYLFESLPDLPDTHHENSFVAFNQERLIPTSVSMDGPGVAVGDVNGDGIADAYVCGGKGQPGLLYIQQPTGHSGSNTFRRIAVPAFERDSASEDVDAVLFDADGNGTNDLMVVSGGQEAGVSLQPRLYLNDGKAHFRRAVDVPQVDINASCIRANDYDRDGDIDVFIGSNVVPGKYGASTRPLLWHNRGGVFQDVTATLLPTSVRDSAGMITDALWADVNSDELQDLVLVGDWMPITMLVQGKDGKFSDATHAYGLGKSNGWWRSVAAADFDKDGDIDLVAGNFGLNSRMRPTVEQPLGLYISDIDNNGSIDPIMTYNNQRISHPFISRDQLVKQVPSLKRKYVSYSNYKDVKIGDILNPQATVVMKQAFTLETSYLENKGGKFEMRALPVTSQFSSVEAISIVDVNADGSEDIVMAGNSDAVQPDIGRADASYGVVLLGDSKGGFTNVGPASSGFVVKGQARCIAPVVGSKGEVLLIVSRNNARPLVYKVSAEKAHDKRDSSK